MGRWSKHSREFWEKAVAEVESGKRSRVEVASRLGVAIATLDYWRRKLAKESPRLVPVVVRRERPAEEAALAELVVGDIAVRFTDRMPARYIGELVRHLRGS